MAGKGNFLTSYKGKKILGYVYGLGAAVVIAGALFKIMHWPGANEMLILGMGTEVIIFVISAFEPPHMDLQWEKVYPELADDVQAAGVKKTEKKASSVTEQLDNMLSKAKIEQDLLDRLGLNLGKLSENVSKMSEVTDAAGSTAEYSAKAKEAAGALGQMKDAYMQAAGSVKGLADATAGMGDFHTQVQSVSKNMSALNALYESELTESNNHLKVMNKFYGTMAEAANHLESTKEDAMKYKDQIASLNKNLGALNSVYGGMLNAMRPAANS